MNAVIKLCRKTFLSAKKTACPYFFIITPSDFLCQQWQLQFWDYKSNTPPPLNWFSWKLHHIDIGRLKACRNPILPSSKAVPFAQQVITQLCQIILIRVVKEANCDLTSRRWCLRANEPQCSSGTVTGQLHEAWGETQGCALRWAPVFMRICELSVRHVGLCACKWWCVRSHLTGSWELGDSGWFIYRLSKPTLKLTHLSLKDSFT